MDRSHHKWFVHFAEGGEVGDGLARLELLEDWRFGGNFWVFVGEFQLVRGLVLDLLWVHFDDGWFIQLGFLECARMGR